MARIRLSHCALASPQCGSQVTRQPRLRLGKLVRRPKRTRMSAKSVTTDFPIATAHKCHYTTDFTCFHFPIGSIVIPLTAWRKRYEERKLGGFSNSSRRMFSCPTKLLPSKATGGRSLFASEDGWFVPQHSLRNAIRDLELGVFAGSVGARLKIWELGPY